MANSTTHVPPSGDPLTAKYIIVSDLPGRMEIIRGQPIAGNVCQELDKILQDVGIKKSDCYITNAIKDCDFPLYQHIQFKSKKPPVVSEYGQIHFNNLYKELNNCKSTTIIAFGDISLYALTGRTSITNWRGSILQSPDVKDKNIIPTFHPSTILPPKFQYLNKHLIFFDIKKAKSIQEETFKFIPKNLITNPSYYQCLDFIDQCIYNYKAGKIPAIAYDIEVSNFEVSCISFASSKSTAICIPFIGPRGNYFSLDQETTIWIKIAELLEDETIPKLGQNLVFDVHFNLRKYGIHAKNLHDTMILQQILMPDYKKGLDFIAALWTDIPYYKEEGKFWLKGIGSWERGWEYNALDSLVCICAFEDQLKEVTLRNNLSAYNRTRKVILPLVYMMERGVKIDVNRMKESYKTSGIEIENIKNKLNTISKRTLNANSPKQLQEYFFTEKGVKPYKSKGKISTNEDVMKRLSRRGFKEAEIILKIRGKVKERSTYLNIEKVDKDERMRCSYNPVGTRYSRLSSSETIFGTGNNLQNQPHNILTYFLADPGYAGYEIDLSQAENRIVAYVGRVAIMINAFETNQDVHSLTGALISGKTPEEVKQEAKEDICCPIGGGNKTWRFWGKKANHGFNYDLGPDNFSLTYEIAVSEGRKIYHSYHKVYPEIQRNFHGHVKTCLIKTRTIENLMGRKTFFMGDINSSRARDKTFKIAYSCIPQGTVGDMINERALNLIYYSPKYQKVELLMQVHDSIKFQIPLDLGWEKHAELLIGIKEELELPLVTHYGREFSIPADIQIGKNFGHMEEFKAFEIGRDVKEFGVKLEKKWNFLEEEENKNVIS